MNNLIIYKAKYVLTSIVLLFIISYINSVYVLGWINLLSLLYFGYGIIKIQKQILSPFLLIGICLYIFHSGHLWLSLFNISPEQFLQSFQWYGTSSINEIYYIYSIVTSVLIIYMTTGILFLKSSSYINTLSQTILPSIPFKCIFFGLYIVLIIFDCLRAKSVSALGYGGGYKYNSDIVLNLSVVVDLLLLLFLYLYRNNKKYFKLTLGLQIFKALLIMFFVGNRGASVISLLIALFILAQYSYLGRNKARLRKIVLFSAIFLLVSLPFISMTRGGKSSIGFNDFVKQENPIEIFLTEFGGTVYNVFLVSQYVETQGTSQGLQILATSFALMPGSTFVFGNVITQNVSIGSMLNKYFNREGLGGSMIAQLYFNFGNSVYLYISIFLLALLSSWVSNRLLVKPKSIYSIFIYLCLFSGLMTFVRGEWYDVIIKFKFGLYLVALMYLFRNLLFYRTSYGKSNY